MKHFLFTLSLVFVLVSSCESEETVNAQSIIDKTIEVSGGEKYNTSTISFEFRSRHYIATRNNGLYKFERIVKDSVNTTRDVLTNEGFNRFVNEDAVEVADSMIPRYSSSINSVHYFITLPYGLNDAAVNKEYLGEATIKEKTYHKIKVFFNQDGGGEDYEDVFVYWINKETDKLEYLAYSYEEADGLGLRFRVSYNERYVNGIRFVDYINFKPEEGVSDLILLDSLYEAKKLKLLSKIENVNIKVD